MYFTEAKKEEEAYNRYKESRRVNRVSYVGTVGGEFSLSVIA